MDRQYSAVQGKPSKARHGKAKKMLRKVGT
jgi:hypothetical protein